MAKKRKKKEWQSSEFLLKKHIQELKKVFIWQEIQPLPFFGNENPTNKAKQMRLFRQTTICIKI